ncbi:TlpA family protein disulfide reductase [Effusibacillus consociatus]|uniref:TlpA family protein disulfide reductase n=1 Tax=Effusibacillus consociatus TaxID=1117041 RepID=A0ABV9Q0X8_9BACL
MKNWQIGLGIVVVAGLALSAVFTNIGGKETNPGQGNPPTTQQPTGQKPALPQPGHPAPDFALQDITGKTVKLSDLKGKPVLINFWASWCGPCRMEMPDLVKKSEAYKDQIVFLGVNLTDTETDPEGPRKFLKEFNVKYPNLLDQDGQVASLYQALGIPTTVTIGPDGIVVDRIQGAMPEVTMERIIQNLVKKR